MGCLKMNFNVFTIVLGYLLTNGLAEESHFSLNYSQNRDSEFIHLNKNSAITPRKIRFEDDSQFLDNIDFEQSGQPLRFEDSPTPDETPGATPGRVTFQDDNRIAEEDSAVNAGNNELSHVTFQDDQNAEPLVKKKRRRRRKPRYQIPQGQYYPGAPIPGPEYPGYPGQLYPGGNGVIPGGRPVGQYYRPSRRPKQSFASEALSKVAGALTSIALYDDYQCVPRLLCEAAGGGALGDSPVLQSIAGLQPLLTLLSAYNGISTSPLFVFGRAVFLGMTSKANTASCRYAYPQCPTDPEQLVHYLNNHNGGFFRFFNSPQPQIPQNVEQFYNQLSGQYGFQQNPYEPLLNQANQNQPFGYQQNIVPQNYGAYNPQLGPQNPDQLYGYYQPNPQNYPQQNFQLPGQNYGFYQPNPYHEPSYQRPSGHQLYNRPYAGLNSNSYANKFKYYGSKYPYKSGSKYGLKNIRFKDNGKQIEIEKRIQNIPTYLYIDSDVGNVDINTKWIFPENSKIIDNIHNDDKNVRSGKGLKFPEDNKLKFNTEDGNGNSNRKGKTILFPVSQNTRYVNYYEYPSNQNNYKLNYQNYDIGNSVVGNHVNSNYNNYNNGINSNQYGNSYNNNDNIRSMYSSNYLYSNNNAYSKYMYNNEEEDGVQTVYIVRGNGDPNHPEIVKVGPGEKVLL